MSNTSKPSFLELTHDHSTLLLSPEMYKVYHVVLRVVFGLTAEDIIYSVRTKDEKESMTHAINVGGSSTKCAKELDNTLFALVQPSEPLGTPSHVRKMLGDHTTPALWQHFALRTEDILALHQHMSNRGVNFITPILEDKKEDLLQVFTGELFCPSSKQSAVFFEFVQRTVTEDMRQMLLEQNRETFFRDDTFLGLYGVKEAEYQGSSITPFIDHELFGLLDNFIGEKKQWEITPKDISQAETIMMEHAKQRDFEVVV